MKYAPLGEYLDSLDADEIDLALTQISHILGFPLPPYARKRQFWGNSRKGHAQAGPGWLDYQWKVARLKKSKDRIVGVTFHRPRAQSTGTFELDIVRFTPEELAEMRRVPIHSLQAFRDKAEEVFSNKYATVFPPGYAANVDHKFDFIAVRDDIVGECRLFRKLPKGGPHSGTLSAISEGVFFLQHAPVGTRFMVFGGDRRVPMKWLSKHGGIATGVDFYFLAEDGNLELLQPAHPVRPVTGGA